MYSRILVATDLSEDSDRALAAADAIAKRDHAKLALIHVMPNLAPISMLFPQAVASGALATADLERKAGEAVTDRLRNLTGREGDEVEIFVETGNDYAAVVERAEEWKADLVVVGSHGRTGMKRALLGSVSEKIVRYAHADVLIARAGAHPGPVVAATDLSELSMHAVEAAAREAKLRGAELVVVHAVDTLPLVEGHVIGTPLGMYGGLDANTAEALVETARGALEGALASRKIQAKQETLHGPAAPLIVDRAEGLEAQLLVIATHGRTGLKRAVLGSVAESVVRHAPCPTLVVRARD